LSLLVRKTLRRKSCQTNLSDRFIEQPTSEVQRLAGEIVSRIVSGAYPCGLRLPSEVALATEFGCGRSTVREALRHVATMGLVRSRRGSGAMVLDFRREGTPALLPVFLQVGKFDTPVHVIAAELLRLRTMMACEAVRLAACYASVDDLAEARQRLADAPALSDDPVAHAGNELEFYRALVAASGMWPATWLVNSFWGPLREVHRLVAPTLGVVAPEFQPTMQRLLELIEQKDEHRATGLVRDWFEQVDRQLVDVLKEALGAGS